ncbi:alkaline phosphatase-like isoform X1 [Artemia franciscana]
MQKRWALYVTVTVILSSCSGFPQFDIKPKDVDHRTSGDTKGSSSTSTLEDASYWNQIGQNILSKHKSQRPIEKQAKNVILFIGDGMSSPTITAARIYKGQQFLGTYGEDTVLEFENFPNIGISKTYCIDYQVGDSACTGTAYLTGVKANLDTIGVDINVKYNNCSAQNMPEYHVNSIMKWAQDVGKSTGIVTNTRVTHATPASSYAHTANRNWESDADLTYYGQQNSTICDDIAEQLVYKEPGKNFKVILGGGRSKFQPNTTADPEEGMGSRFDGVDLIQEWGKSKENMGKSHKYVTSRDELMAVDIANTDYILGLFERSHLGHHLLNEGKNNPTLEEMTTTAINLLQKDTTGFVLLVESGHIDIAHHEGKPHLALHETIELEKAVAAARKLTDTHDTLIIVTADHSHTMTINGYPLRGDSIFGVGYISDVDHMPWTTLSYANGPGYRKGNPDGSRYNITDDDFQAIEYKPIATAPTNSETHGGDDVAVYAIGPQAHLLQGVYEQNYIAHLIGYAACMGPGDHFCESETNSAIPLTSSLHTLLAVFIIYMIKA